MNAFNQFFFIASRGWWRIHSSGPGVTASGVQLQQEAAPARWSRPPGCCVIVMHALAASPIRLLGGRGTGTDTIWGWERHRHTVTARRVMHVDAVFSRPCIGATDPGALELLRPAL